MAHHILFTGHMIDKAGRATPRFPASKEVAASLSIEKILGKIQQAGTPPLTGIAAAACGGDILFHEACIRTKISSEIYLGIPAEAFQQTSVAFAGQIWLARYRALVAKLPVHILHPEATAKAPDSIWEEANQWMLDTALSGGQDDHLTLIALWDQAKADGLGGTEHMVRVAEAHHATIEIIDVLQL